MTHTEYTEDQATLFRGYVGEFVHNLEKAGVIREEEHRDAFANFHSVLKRASKMGRRTLATQEKIEKDVFKALDKSTHFPHKHTGAEMTYLPGRKADRFIVRIGGSNSDVVFNFR